MSSIQHALIMAAGRGNRMRPLTDILPKAMVPYNGDTLIGNSLQKLQACVPNIHITVGYKKAMLAEYLMTKGVDSLFNTEGHGNAWWIQHTLMQYINEPVLVLTADNITEIDLPFLENEYDRLEKPACMLVPVKPIPGIEGDYIRHENGRVLALSREIVQPIYCSGIQVLNPAKVMKTIKQDMENFTDIWQTLISTNHLMVSSVYPKLWFSVDTLDQLKNLSES